MIRRIIIALGALLAFVQPAAASPVLLISIDGLRPSDVIEAQQRGLKVPNLRRFPRMGRRYLDRPPQSVEALAGLAALPAGAATRLREYLHGDYLILYTDVQADATVVLLSIRHHRQLSFDFERLWPRA